MTHHDDTIVHVGTATVLMSIAGLRILTDPVFDPPARVPAVPRTSVTRFLTSTEILSGPAIAADAIGAIDLVLLSHDHHHDNLDDSGRALLPSSKRVLTTTAGAARLNRRGVAHAQGLAPWEKTVLDLPDGGTITVTATPARHAPPPFDRLAGPVIGFHLRHDPTGRTVWISGDTHWYPALHPLRDLGPLDLALVHLGAAHFPRMGPIRFSMSADDALALADVLAPRTLTPIHFEGWAHFTQGIDAVERTFAASPHRDRLRVLPRGERVPLWRDGAVRSASGASVDRGRAG